MTIPLSSVAYRVHPRFFQPRHPDGLYIVHGLRAAVAQLYGALPEDPGDADPGLFRLELREILVGLELEIHVASRAVRAGRTVPAHEGVLAEFQVDALDLHGLVFVVAEVFEPVVDLGL